LWLLNSHFESTAQFKEARVNQLKSAFKKMEEKARTHSVLFAGDLNLRDSEVNFKFQSSVVFNSLDFSCHWLEAFHLELLISGRRATRGTLASSPGIRRVIPTFNSRTSDREKETPEEGSSSLVCALIAPTFFLARKIMQTGHLPSTLV